MNDCLESSGIGDSFNESRQQQALLTAAALQRAIFNSANFSSIATDAAGVIQIFNVGAEQMLGFSADEVINKLTPADLSDPQELIARAESLSRELDTQITPGFEALVFKASRGIEDIYELTYIRRDGSRFPAVVSVTALRDPQENIIGYLLIGTDNSARKQAEAVLRESETRLTFALQKCVAGAWDLDLVDLTAYRSLEHDRIFGYESLQPQWTYEQFLEHVVPEDRPEVDRCFSEATTALTDWGFECRIRRHDGELRWIWAAGEHQRDNAGHVRRMAGIVQDITDRKLAEVSLLNATEVRTELAVHQRAAAALAASEAQARAIVETALDAYVAMDSSGRIIEWNRQAELTFGWQREEVVGKDLSTKIIPHQHRQAHAHGLAHFLATGEGTVLNQRMEISALHRSGREFPVELTVWPVKSGSTFTFHAFLRDIADRKKAIRRLAAQTTAAAVLVESLTLDEAAPKILEAVCNELGWAIGAIWVVDRINNSLHCAHFWNQAGVRAPAFEAMTRSMSLAPGDGMPGRVWQDAKPLWVTDLPADMRLPRAHSAAEDNLHGAFWVPIISAGVVLGVLEFLSSQIEEPDHELLAMMDTLGALLGQFIQSKSSETALRIERQFLAVLLDHLSDGIVACDESGTLTLFNKATRAFHGLPEQPLAADQWGEHYDLYLADGLTPMRTEQIPLFRAFQGEVIQDVEIVIAPKHRERRTLLCNGQSLIGPAGAKLGAVVAMHDITERKRSQAALEQSNRGLAENEQRLEEAQTLARVGSWEWDLGTETLSWSDEMYRIYGVDPRSFTPSFEDYMQRAHPDDRETILAAVQNAIQTREPFGFEHRIILADGKIRTVQARGRVIADEKGNVLRMLGTGHDVTEFKDTEQRLQQLAHFDSLTSLPNRTLFYQSLHESLAHAAEQGWIVSVLFLDVDHFKIINDTMGHACGDELLRQLARRLVRTLRVRDVVGRLGGDEFAIILMNPDNPQSAGLVANKLRNALVEPFELDGREVTVTASLGITVYPEDATEAEVLLKYADTAMYAAKESGRDTYRFYTAAMNASAVRRLDLDNALRRALDHDEFVLHYQPKVDLASGRWAGAEALLRWNRPGHGLVSPAEFIPLLEETGLIEPVGIWVIETACRQIAAWIDAGIGSIPIAVNVSVKQLLRGRADQGIAWDSHDAITGIGSPVLEAALERALQEHGIPSKLLEIELTESTLMLNAAKTVGLLQRLKSLGIRISIDDFGTGYSSLAYLKRFPIDTIKIDQTFIRDISIDPDDAAIAVAIISLAHSLSLKVIAEGVETREQLEFLRAHGCDEVQGYYLARPMAADAIVELMRASSGRCASLA